MRRGSPPQPSPTLTSPTTNSLWLLPVGSIPEPQTLGRLLAAHRRSPSVGLVGPKHVDATNPRTLRSVGINTTRTGRIVEDPPLGEPDQGQYDLRRDVLAIPLAGMLASASLLRELGGWEPSFGDLGGDLDLGWRAQLAGQRVIVAPDARMRSVASVGLATATTGARRRAARRVALTRASWWLAPFLALWILATSLAAAAGLLLLKRPRPAAEAFADLGSLDPVRGILSRLRTRGRRDVRHRDIATLFVPASAIVRTGLDRAHEALVAPTTLVEEDTTEADDRALISRGALHPGVLAVLATIAVVAAAGREIGGGLLSRFGSGVTGGELVTTRATSSSLWHAAFDGWHGTGLGGDGPASPSLALLAIPTWIVEHLPGSGDLTSPAGAVVGALLVLALPLAALSAYVSAKVLGSSRGVRAVAAVAWATTGAAGASVAQGRTRCARRPHPPARSPCRSRPPGPPQWHRHGCVRHRAGRGRARRVRPASARARRARVPRRRALRTPRCPPTRARAGVPRAPSCWVPGWPPSPTTGPLPQPDPG